MFVWNLRAGRGRAFGQVLNARCTQVAVIVLTWSRKFVKFALADVLLTSNNKSCCVFFAVCTILLSILTTL
jgi:hypothetical protein